MKEKLKRLPKSAVWYLLFAVFMIIVISLKANYYLDEIYSYGLANGVNDGIDMEITYNFKYEPGESVYYDYMRVQDGERFAWRNVWKNQKNDVHPPLYYFVLHTICSLFPNTFSRWYAGGINIVCALFVLFLLRKLISLLTDEGYIRELLSFTFIMLTGVLHQAANFRMYLMGMLFVTLFTFLFVRQVGKKQQHSFYMAVFITAVCGALTHYYVTLYIVFASIVYGICLLSEKRLRETLLYTLTMAGAAAVSLLIFPPMIEHMFFGYRGAEAVANLAKNSSYAENLKGFFEFLDQQMFGKILGILLAVLLVLALLRFAGRFFQVSSLMGQEKLVFGFRKYDRIRYCIVLLPCFFYYIVVSKITFAVADRYISPIYAVLFAGLLCMVYRLLRYALQGKSFLMMTAFVTAALILGSHQAFAWEYLFLESRQTLVPVEEHSKYDCVCVFDEDETYLLYPEYAEFSLYKSVTFVTTADLKENGIQRWITSDGIVVSFFLREKDAKKYLKRIKRETGFENVQKLGTFGFDNTYFLGK